MCSTYYIPRIVIAIAMLKFTVHARIHYVAYSHEVIVLCSVFERYRPQICSP